MSLPRRGDAGVTLIEVLVSLAIFAVIGLAGLAVLDTVARTGERTDGRLDRMAEIDRAFVVMRRDLAQMVGAETRLDGDALTFRRLIAEGSVRISYRLDSGTLLREVQAGGAPEAVAQRMLPDVSASRWRVLGPGGWADSWPPDGAAPPRPRAAELTLEVVRAAAGAAPQTVTRLFVLPAGQGR